MSDISQSAVNAAQEADLSYCKFITPNDVGATGGHQSGYLIGVQAWRILFPTKGVKGENNTRTINIDWYNYGITQSHAKWYGNKTRSEYRITTFGRGFPWLRDEHIGDLLVLVQMSGDEYRAFVLSIEADIEEFLAEFNLDSTSANVLISNRDRDELGQALSGLHIPPMDEEAIVDQLVAAWKSEWVPSAELSAAARGVIEQTNPIDGRLNPDGALLAWLAAEYNLFKRLELAKYGPLISAPFTDLEALITFANALLNRRKSRAGRSFEHQLREVFTLAQLTFDHPGHTEGNSQPDFIFPTAKYFDVHFPSSKLVMLAAKTTCKDRWRQILTEAAKIPSKHLCTLQQGISSNQLAEMQKEGVVLVVPETYKKFYPPAYHDSILSLRQFIAFVRVSAL